MSRLGRFLVLVMLLLFSAGLRSAEAVGSIVWDIERLDFWGGEVTRLYLDYRYSPERLVCPVHGILTFTDNHGEKWYTVLYGTINVKPDSTLFGKLNSGNWVIIFITDQGLNGEIRLHTPPDHVGEGIGRMVYRDSW